MLPLTTILILSIYSNFYFYFCLQFILAALNENYTPSKKKCRKNTALQILKTKILYKIKKFSLTILATGKQICRLYALFLW